MNYGFAVFGCFNAQQIIADSVAECLQQNVDKHFLRSLFYCILTYAYELFPLVFKKYYIWKTEEEQSEALAPESWVIRGKDVQPFGPQSFHLRNEHIRLWKVIFNLKFDSYEKTCSPPSLSHGEAV